MKICANCGEEFKEGRIINNATYCMTCVRYMDMGDEDNE
jgi:hypothetical protein